MRILLVDDSFHTRERVKEILTKELTCEIIEGANGLEAIENFKTHQPDLVIMGIAMPEMDGLTALEKIKELSSSAYVIMLTTLGEKEIVLKAIKLGAKDFIIKPPSPERIITTVKKALQVKKTLDEQKKR